MLDRTQARLPLKPGKCGTYAHDDVRNGTATLFVALNTLEGTVFGRCAPRHRHGEFIAILDQIEEPLRLSFPRTRHSPDDQARVNHELADPRSLFSELLKP